MIATQPNKAKFFWWSSKVQWFKFNSDKMMVSMHPLRSLSSARCTSGSTQPNRPSSRASHHCPTAGAPLSSHSTTSIRHSSSAGQIHPNIVGAVQPGLSNPLMLRASSPNFDEPISTGIRRTRNEFNDDQLAPERLKRLKTHTQELCERKSIPEHLLMPFVQSGDPLMMLLDVQANIIQFSLSQQDSQLNCSKDLLYSKDLENLLQHHMAAVLLSLNLTAYVVDTQRHVMDLICEHPDMFKLPPIIFEDAELKTALSKIVTKVLATIRGQFKIKLTASLVKRIGVVELMKTLASGSMETDASHWNRVAFLQTQSLSQRRCLRVFLIGTSDYKDANIKQCYSPFISPSLAGDLHRKVEQELGINISEHQSDIRAPGEIDADTGNNGDTEYVAGNEDNTLRHDSNEGDAEADADADASGILDGNEAAEDGDCEVDQDGDDSGFGLEGHIAKWTTGNF
ncbi:uncharacterized protein F5891DRAFT_1191655 [Suillus fuscotomentosus]|uniref:Uncharacterized protein n=1 Tax=Suillus fuscotomentosus TaxID=1912939 RepID=A0AAD4E1B5_9AGAM|nr:uncharacterized protein F5891DRAFT_1191655 [Suillus fuscotomentosus]KAG1897725.1 hypothetical protein F5891DRAFT_1191655 [Suillus fuscotomentosus]